MEREERIQRMLTFSRKLASLSEIFHETAIEFKYAEDKNTANAFVQEEKLMMQLKEILE